MPALAKTLLYGLGGVFSIENVYSATKIGRFFFKTFQPGSLAGNLSPWFATPVVVKDTIFSSYD